MRGRIEGTPQWETGKDRSAIERQLGEVQREHARVLDLLARGIGDENAPGARSKELGAREGELGEQLSAEPEPLNVVALHPGVLDRFERQLEALQASLVAGMSVGDDDGQSALRELVDTVTVRPGTKAGSVSIEIVGRLNALLGDPDNRVGLMVAREGL